MSEALIVACSVAAGLAALRLLRRASPNPTGLWTAAFVSILAAGISEFLLAGRPGSASLPSFFGTVYPALLLAGACLYSERPLPLWLLPLALAVAALRAGLAASGQVVLDHGLALVLTPAGSLAAAGMLLRAPPESARGPAYRLLPPVLAAVALLQLLTAALGLQGRSLSSLQLVFWLGAVLVTLALQLAMLGRSSVERLARARSELEERVGRRTADLRQAVASLEAEVAERRAVEAALRASEERYRTISELSSDFSYALRVRSDDSYEVEWMTEAFQRITGYEAAEISELDWLEIVHPEDRAHAERSFGALVRGELDEFELRIVTKWGEPRSLIIHMRLQRTDDDGSLRLVGSTRDVTERRRAEQEQLRLEQQMHEVQRLESLGVLAGGIAHDFNNLLTVILGSSRLLLGDRELDPSLRRRLGVIEDAARHAARLTDQMLTYAGRSSTQRWPLDVDELVASMDELLRAAIGESVELSVERSGKLPGVVGDETQLRQVLLNLVGNASESLGEGGGHVRIRTGVQEGVADERLFGTERPPLGPCVYVEVSDDGPGIDEASQARIFDPFFTTKFAGRGLGLAAVLGIVRAHQGAIRIRSAPGAGASFRVLLPVASAEREAETPAGPEARAPAPRRSGTILVVDDEEPVLELSAEFLRRAGFAVRTALGGSAGVALFRERAEEIDAVVLDLAMPSLGGAQVLERLREIRPGIPVLLATGYGEAEARRRLGGSASIAFLAKPFEAEALAEALDDLLADPAPGAGEG